MPLNSTGAIGSLEIIDSSVPAGFQQKLNDRLRKIAAYIGSANGSSSTGGSSSSSVGQIEFAVPGILAVQSDVAPVLTLPAARTFSKLLVFLKIAPIGGSFTVQLYVNGSAWGPSVSIAAGAKSASANVSGTAAIPADQIIRLDVTACGTTYPGSDLTVMLR